MKNYYILSLVVWLGCLNSTVAQEDTIIPPKVVDSLYKEDQFYFALTYNILVDLPDNLRQSGFSLGLKGGFIKDMPLNKRRNVAIGVGIGYSYNSYNQNLGILKDNNNVVDYLILDDSYGLDYSKNNFYQHIVELPIEFRWRTSTPTDYRFWRVYTGFKIGYVFSSITNFKGEAGDYRYTDIDGFNNIQYGLTLSAGYNTWNFYVYYGLTPIFKDNVKTYLTHENIDMSAIKLGLIFYLL